MKTVTKNVYLLLAIFSLAAAAQGEMIIPRGSTWKYNNQNIDFGAAVRELSYDDGSWVSGPGPLGAGDAHQTTVIDLGPSGTRFATIYFRKTFTMANTNGYTGFTMRVLRDDGCYVYLNGNLVAEVNVPAGLGFSAYSAVDAGDATAEQTYFEFPVSVNNLRVGENVFLVEGKNATAGSSDFGFDLELEGSIDNVAPTLTGVDPVQGANVISLDFINVVFSESVSGVTVGDLLINSAPASSLVTNNPNDYTFYFTQPPTGTVQVAFAPAHGIVDVAVSPNAFAGGSWTYNLDTNISTRPNIIISEFLAGNESGIKDDDDQRNDWLELYNLGPLDANLEGWYLTDTITNLTKWRIPAVALNNNNYVIIWASEKNRSNLNLPLHTNFKLSKDAGGFLALVDRQTNIVSMFTNYPVQFDNVSYGRDRTDPSMTGYFNSPTPGVQNVTTGSGFLGVPVFSHKSGVYTDASLVVTISNTNVGGTIRYTTDATTPTASSPVYSAPITVSANSTVKARVFPVAGSTLFPSTVAARNFILLDASAANFNSKLPTMIISTEGRSIPSSLAPGLPRTRGSLVVIDTKQGRSSIQGEADVHELAEFEIFGQTSEGFTKKPHRIEIQDALGNDLDTEVLGMPADSDWRLRNPFNDKTYLNDFLGFELWEEMGHYSVRRKFVEVFLDTGGARLTYPGDYYGVMLLCETIKIGNDRVDVPKMSPYMTNQAALDKTGFIVKRDKDSTGDLNFTSPGGPGFGGIPLKLHEPKVQEMRNAPLLSGMSSFPGPGYTTAATNQLNYIRNWLGTMERTMYTNTWLSQTGTNHYSHYVDVVRFADQFLHVELTKQIDGYRLSDYFTRGRDGKFGPGPVWDWNLAFGNADYAQGGMTNTWYYELQGDINHPWARRLIAGTSGATGTSGDPDFVQLCADRWAMFRTNVLNGTNLMARIDELANTLRESAARDLYGKYRSSVVGVDMWPNPDGTGEGRDVDFVRPTNYFGPLETKAPATATNSIIGQMKKWMLGRYLWMDGQFCEPPTISAAGAMVTNGFQVTITPPPGAALIYTVNGTDPRLSGGAMNPAAVSNNGPVTVTVNANTRIFARSRRTGTWKNTWGGPAAETFFTTTPSLRITEIMFNPAPPPAGSPYDAQDFEYIEVKNIGNTTLNVAGFSLDGGVQFEFPNVILNAGQSAVVVKNVAAFQSRYGTSMLILGTFTGGLNNAGDHLTLNGGLEEPILDFSYSENWFPVADGLGFSLVVVNDGAATTAWDSAAGWRTSAAPGGSPGVADPAPPTIDPVLISELLTHGDLTAGDAVELHNPNGADVNIGGWFLTDDFDSPKKFTIPAGTIVPANGYLVLYETNGFGLGGNGWGFSSRGGEEAYLFSGNGINLTGYGTGFDFGAASTNVTFGRYVISTGEDHYVAQSANTMGAANAGPVVGPIVISEVSYHPADIAVEGSAYDNEMDEFIELHNISGAAVQLFDAAFPTNTWRLTDAVDFAFPQNVTIPAGGYVLVVGFDPADTATLQAFRSANLVPPTVPVYGPWSGQLNNDSDRVELRMPSKPDVSGAVDQILVERVSYSDVLPWPTGADGLGLTMQRIVEPAYGNDPTNWTAAAATPGSSFVGGGSAPAITGQPGSQVVIFGSDVSFPVTVTGTQPIRYQWRLNGLNIVGETNTTLHFDDFQADDVGVYSVFVYNSAGYAVGTNFTLSGRTQLQITSQPEDRVVRSGLTANFSVGAVGTGLLRYQWRFNGAPLATATNSSLAITNAQLANEGTYSVVVTDDFGSLTSDEVDLEIVFTPIVSLRPFNMTVVEGTDVSLSVAASGTEPISFRWRTNGVNISNVVFIVTGTNSTIVIPNITPNFTGLRFTVAITNIAGQAPLTTNAVLTVLADADKDGLPDEWETGRPGFNVNDAADGTRDEDGDGMSNGAEYLAGTDPLDANSVLRISIGQNGTINFEAKAYRSYSIQYADTVPSQAWSKLRDLLTRASSSNESVVDPNVSSNRFYRVVVPAQP